jgi:predicted nucleic acid-binding protein
VILVLPDTSVWARREQASVATGLAQAIDENRVAVVLPIVLELLRSATDVRQLRLRARRYDALRQLPLRPEIGARARVVQERLAERGYHRGPSPTDLVAAAAAELYGAELWHCDRHFELIAEVTGQPVRRVGR